VSDCELKVEAGGEWARADMMGAAGFLFVQDSGSCGSLINQGSFKDKALARNEP